MFERDKDELRSMGIPVDTVVDDLGEVQGYRIPRDSYGMPPLDFTVAERSALAVAAQVWGQAVIAPVAGTAVRKLEALDSQIWAPSVIPGTVHLGSTEAALLPLMQAIRTDRVVTFAYRSPGVDEAVPRTLSPWRLAAEGGHWRVSGHDHDRKDLRTFRLSRIYGTVTVTSRQREPETANPETTSQQADDLTCRARVRVQPGRAASLRRMAHGAPGAPDAWAETTLEVACATSEELVRAICGAGPDAVVLDPPEIREAVRQRLALLASEHTRTRP